jgi:hypothetical protein
LRPPALPAAPHPPALRVPEPLEDGRVEIAVAARPRGFDRRRRRLHPEPCEHRDLVKRGNGGRREEERREEERREEEGE